jgi:hypothetical protein
MKAKYIYSLLSALLVVFLFAACEKEPSFPDPGFEIGDQRIEVRRDTADVYNIEMRMEVPNGVQTIQLLNAADYTVLENIEEYNGKTKFDFVYPVDLTPFEQDTVLNYIIKVIDNDMRSTNRGIRIDVKGFSFPEILLIGGKDVAVAAPAYVVKGIVSTGLNEINSVALRYKDEIVYSYNAIDNDTVLFEMSLKETVLLGLPDENNDYSPILIEIEDSKGQSSTTTINLRKTTEIKLADRIIYKDKSGNINNIKFHYDDQKRISGFDYVFSSGTYSHFAFQYNDLGVVDLLEKTHYTVDGVKNSGIKYYYNYKPGTEQLESVEEQYLNYEGGEFIGEDPKEVLSDAFTYDETTGNVLSFYTSSLVSDIYYSDPFGLGEQIFGEYWQSSSYMTKAERRQHRSEYEPVLMPTYVKGFQPYAYVGSVLNVVFNDLFWHKYLPLKTVYTNDDYAYLNQPSYKYETDKDGNLTTIVKNFTEYSYGYISRTCSYTIFYE